MSTKAIVAEFIGTFTLVFIGVGAIAAEHAGGTSGLAGIAFAHGLAIAVMVSATAATSGGHLNPAVTIGALVTKNIDAKTAIGYILAQCIGGIFAVFCLRMAIPLNILADVGMGTPALGQTISAGQALATEIILTFFLVFVVFGTAIDSRAPKVGGLFIGLAVAMGILMGGPISGGAMNPARHLGPALFGGGLEHVWLYWVGPVLGGILAALIYTKVIQGKS